MTPRYTLGTFINSLIFLDEEAGEPADYTRLELAHMAAEALDELTDDRCFSCRTDTYASGEYYMVRPELWRTYGVEGMLCIGCLERRVGRRLTPQDFIDAPINSEEFPDKSDRLKDRLGIACAVRTQP